MVLVPVFSLSTIKTVIWLYFLIEDLEKPPSGGVSVFSESVSLEDEMVLSAEKLLSAVGWTGVAMVEFKRDLKDGRAKLMEINGRFWGHSNWQFRPGLIFQPFLLITYRANYQKIQ